MKHCGTKTIETERLILRRFVTDDAEAMYRNWTSDDEVTKFLTWPTHPAVEVSRSIAESWVKSYSDDRSYQWAIVFKENGNEPIGSIAAVRVSDDTESVHIGYCMGRKWWNKGIMSEALKAVIKYFFDEVGAERVDARYDPRNPASGRVMLKSGMKYEGTLRRADRNNQGICDACYCSILRSEI